MALLSPVLDHIVIDVRDRIDEAMRCFSSLGFQLTPRGSLARSARRGGARRKVSHHPCRPGQDRDGPRYFCEHLTLDLVWRPEWQTHPNGAGAVARVVVTTGDPRRTAQLFRGLFGGDAMAEREGRWVMAAGSAQVELAPPNMIAADGSHFCKTRRAVDSLSHSRNERDAGSGPQRCCRCRRKHYRQDAVG